jgi:TolB-like protein
MAQSLTAVARPNDITDLSSCPIARNSSFVYKRAAISVPDVAKALGVRYVLEAAYKAGNRVRVTAQLIDSRGFRAPCRRTPRGRANTLAH